MRMNSLVWYIYIYNVSEMICSSAYFVVNIFWNWCNYGGHFQFGKLIFHRNVWWHRFPLGTACQNFPESESQLKLKIWGAPTFQKVWVPFLNVHFFNMAIIWTKDCFTIQQFNSCQLLQSSSAAKLYIWVSFKVNFNFFGRLSAFATEWWMQGCTQKPSAPKVFTNFNSNFPFPSRKLWNYFQISQKLQGCIRDAFCSQSFDKFQEKPRGGGRWPLSRQQQPSSAI